MTEQSEIDNTFKKLRKISLLDMTILIDKCGDDMSDDEMYQLLIDNGWTEDEYVKGVEEFCDRR